MPQNREQTDANFLKTYAEIAERSYDGSADRESSSQVAIGLAEMHEQLRDVYASGSIDQSFAGDGENRGDRA